MNQPVEFKVEIYRKIFHMLLLILPVSYIFLGKKQFLFVLISLSLLLMILDYLRLRSVKFGLIVNKIFGRILRPHEAEAGLSGATFAAMSAIITFSFFPKLIAINAFSVLALADAVASLVGKMAPIRPFFEKSLGGSLAFLISSIIIVVAYGIGFEQRFSYYCFGIVAALATMIIEARPSILGVDDNFSVPLTFAIVMTLFYLIWSYH